ncbi:MAG: FecR domain-containing protein [Pseudomonadota bacterium]
MAVSGDSAGSLATQSESDRAAGTAAEWFARLSSDEANHADYVAYRAWRDADAANAVAYDRIAQTWDEIGVHADEPAVLEMRVAALAEQPDPEDSTNRTRRTAAIAASIALVLAATTTFFALGSPFADGASPDLNPQMVANETAEPDALVEVRPDSLANVEEETPDFQSGYSTRIGQMAQFTLPDGSVIELNTGSEVQVDYSAARRNLTLVKGEAVFTVAKDSDRPFTVTAGQSRVVALGTIFSVRKTDSEAQVTLIEGRVRVDRDDLPGSGKSAQLKPGEQISILPNRPFAISRAELSQFASWRDGRLVFEQTPLRDVLKEFNRYSIEQHVLADESLGDYLVNGTFRIRSSEHFAATLEAGFPVSVRARPGGTIFEVSVAQEIVAQDPVSNN